LPGVVKNERKDLKYPAVLFLILLKKTRRAIRITADATGLSVNPMTRTTTARHTAKSES
jgi:hypothetical protein